MTFALAIVVDPLSVPGLRPRHVDAPAGAAGGKAALASLDVSWLPGLLERMRPGVDAASPFWAPSLPTTPRAGAKSGSTSAAKSGRPAAPDGWPQHVKPFSGGFGQLAKSLAFTSNIGWGQNMMTKALGLNVGFYGYDPNGASVSALPAGNAHPETNLCYGLLETWLRACSRPSVMLQTAARVGNASNASRAAAAHDDGAHGDGDGDGDGDGGDEPAVDAATLSALLQEVVRPRSCKTPPCAPAPIAPLDGALAAAAAVAAMSGGGGRAGEAAAAKAAAKAAAAGGARTDEGTLRRVHALLALGHAAYDMRRRQLDGGGGGGVEGARPSYLEVATGYVSPAERAAEREEALKHLQLRDDDAMAAATTPAPAAAASAASSASGGGASPAAGSAVAVAAVPAVASKAWRDAAVLNLEAALLGHTPQLVEAAAAADAAGSAAGRPLGAPRTGVRPAAALPAGGPLGPATDVGTNNSPVNGLSFKQCMNYYWSRAGFPFGYLSALVFSIGCVDRLAFGDWAVGVSAGIDAFVNVIGKIFGIGAARGMRATFAAPEEFDVEGPYGVEPFPFQTPGAEKCHRMLNSWLYKCERNG